MQPHLLAFIFLCVHCATSALAVTVTAALSSAPHAANSSSADAGTDGGSSSKSRRKRYISQTDMVAILDYHNKVRGKVFPPASNMEYMVSL